MSAVQYGSIPHPLQILIDAYTTDAPADAEPYPVIGSIGHDVPVELAWAVGARSVRLRGHPGWDRARATTYLGSGLDAATVSLFAGILQGAFGHLDAIVVSSDCDASQRLYYVMREIRRVEPETGLPPVYLTDMLHLPRESTTRYNLRRLEQFRLILRDWFGADPLDGLGKAMASSARIVSMQRQFVTEARGETLRVTGTQALAVFGAAQRMAPRRYADLLAALLDALPGMPALRGPRLFLTGSNHDRPDVYRQIEGTGWIICGEDHDQGQLALQRRFPEAPPPADQRLGVLARVYRDNGPTAQRASIALRARHTAHAARRAGADRILSYVRERDDAPLWDYAAQQRLADVPMALLRDQPYSAVDLDALTFALSTTERTGTSA